MDRTDAIHFLTVMGIPGDAAREIVGRVWKEGMTEDALVPLLQTAASSYVDQNLYGGSRPGGDGLTSLQIPTEVPAGTQVPPVPIDVRELQRILKAAGFNPGPVDGIFGPRTKRAYEAWLAAGKPGPSAQSAGEAPRGGGSSTAPASGGSGGGGSAPADNRSDSEIDDEIRERFPDLAGFLGIPDIAKELRAGIREGWPPEKLQARIRATDWYRSTPAQARAFVALQATDPAQAERQVELKMQDLRRFAREQWALPMTDAVARFAATHMLNGSTSDDDLRKYLTDQAVSLYGEHVRAGLEAGATVRQLADSYIALAAQELEIDENSIDLLDPKWNRMLAKVGADGQKTARTLSDWQAEIRSSAEYGWDNTQGARQKAASFATDLGRMFGRIG